MLGVGYRAVNTPIFPGNLLVAARDIRSSYPVSKYDHRRYLPPMDPAEPFTKECQSEEFRIGYACFKRQVADILEPKTILEIGVGLGISAMAFMDACHSATYIGIDNDYDEGKKFHVRPTDYVRKLLSDNGYKCNVVMEDSLKATAIPTVDLVHIDGCHSYFATIHDVLLAWESNAKWILVDDCRDSTVAAAVLWVAQQKRPGSFEWAYFEDTWTGSILISQETARP